MSSSNPGDERILRVCKQLQTVRASNPQENTKDPKVVETIMGVSKSKDLAIKAAQTKPENKYVLPDSVPFLR